MAKDFSFMEKEENTEVTTFAGIPLENLHPDFRRKLSTIGKMTKEEKENYLLVITKINEEHLEKINKNVQFFFWITVIGLILGILVVTINISNQ